MADFKQALDWLNEGKKVRMSYWVIDDYIFKKDKRILSRKGIDYQDILNNVLFDNNWELYEEKPIHFCSSGPLNISFYKILSLLRLKGR